MQRQPTSYATQINANCRCAAVVGGACPPLQTHLRWTWTSSGMSSYWDGCTGFCNPMNCSNTACSTKGCNNARAQFCLQHGKQCGSTKKCYGPQGQDPCPSSCNKTTEEAVREVTNYLMDQCGLRSECGDCIGIYNWMKGNLLAGWSSGLGSIRTAMCTHANIGGMSYSAFVAKVANAFRCSFIADKAFNNCRSGCAGGTCGGVTCQKGTHLNANNCHCDPDKDWLTDFFGSWCHTFDFLPWGGCNNQTNTLLFLGGIAILVFVMMRRV